MTKLKRIARNWAPPALVRWVRKKRGSDNYFEGPFPTWRQARESCTGYDSLQILSKVLVATMKVKGGEATYERDSVLFDAPEYEWPVIAALLRTAVRHNGRLSVLDFGGALGSSYFQNRKLLDTAADLRWAVVEQDHYVNAGRQHIEDSVLRFYSSIGDCTAASRPNAILLSSVLQYLENPEEILSNLVECDADIIILDRTIINASESHRIYVQRVPASIYQASYPCRSLSRSKLLRAFAPHYHFVSEFSSLEFPALQPIESSFGGFIFERSHA